MNRNHGVVRDVQTDMTAHRPRVIAAIVAVTLLGACGAGDSMSSPPTSPTDPGGLRPPVAVHAVDASASAGGDGRTMSAESSAESSVEPAASTDMSIMPAFGGFTYELGDGLAELPEDTTAYQYPQGADVDEATVAALADALGVASAAERVDDETTGLLWRAGPDDGTAPALSVNRDPQLTWSYSGAWADQTMPAACGEVVEADGTVVPPADASTMTTVVGGDAVAIDNGDAVAGDADGGGTDPCAAPEPPDGVPTVADAEAAANDLLAAIGEDPAAYELETYADEWSASVIAWPSLAGVRSPVSLGFGFGAEGVLQWANGSLADPVPAGPYPLVDLDVALTRLTEQTSPSILARSGPLVDVVDPAPATASAGSTGSPTGAATGEPTIETIVPEPAPAPQAATATAADPAIPIEPPPPLGTDPGVQVEPEVATLVEVRADFWWAVDADGSVWLLPAYTFTDNEDRQHTVPAVTDEFLVVAETPTDEPSAGEPAMTIPPESVSPTSEPGVSTSTTTDPPTVDPALLVGLNVDEATKVLAERGLTLRVVREDGVDLAVTEDFSETRVNVVVEQGTVTAVVSLG